MPGIHHIHSVNGTFFFIISGESCVNQLPRALDLEPERAGGSYY